MRRDVPSRCEADRRESPAHVPTGASASACAGLAVLSIRAIVPNLMGPYASCRFFPARDASLTAGSRNATHPSRYTQCFSYSMTSAGND